MAAFWFWFIQAPGWLLFAYLLAAQCVAAISYGLGVRMGTQEPASRVTGVGVAFWKGFAGADLVFYTPLLGLGLAGHALGADWGQTALAAGLGVTGYWPIVCLWTVRVAHGAPGWDLPNERQYWVVLPVISAWGLLGLAALLVQ